MEQQVKGRWIIIEEYLTVSEVCNILKIGRNKGYKLVSQNDFPKIRIGNTIRIPKHLFEQYIERYAFKKIET